MKYAELTRKSRRLGCYPTRFGAGSHEIWRNPATRCQVPIPYHRTKDIGTGIVAQILRKLAIAREDFEKA
jgi:predicted RNA binding protein YcfA (HicA-like mRNA interferase family)